MFRSYSELIRIPTFEERLKYLQIKALVGDPTFGSRRYLNQEFYHSYEWKKFRDLIIVRDNGCDLACSERLLENDLVIHHINPLSLDAMIHGDYSMALDPENAVLTSDRTHRAIHYGIKNDCSFHIIERKPFDTCPWKFA